MRLTDHDASFLYSETASSPMHGAGVAILEGEVSFEAIFAHLERRIHLVPRYRQRLVYVPMNIAHPKWVDDPEFDLHDHVKPKTLPAGTTLEEAIPLCLEMCEPLLDREKSLWMMYVVEGVPGHTLLISQAHHAMIDGVSTVDVSVILMDFEPDAAPPGPPNEAWEPAALPGPLELWNEALADNVSEIGKRARLPSFDPERLRLLGRAAESVSRFVTEPVITAPWNAGQVGPKRNLEWTRYSFAEFREIRRVFGGTINDVVLTVVSEAAARYLTANDEYIDNQYMRIMCPVSVRREGEEGALGNRVSAMYPRLPAWPMEITDRLRVVCEETARLKANKEPQGLELMQESAPFVPPVAMGQTLLVGTRWDPTALAAQFPPPVTPRFGRRPSLVGFNFTCTNVPGVQVPQYIAGHKIIAPLGALMLSGTLGYGVVVASYNQDLYFNFTCDPRLMPDLAVMRAKVQDAFGELLEAARAQAQSTAQE